MAMVRRRFCGILLYRRWKSQPERMHTEMNKTLAARRAPSLQEIQPSFPEVGIASRAVIEDSDRHPEASIKGDFGIIVTEQEVARGPITGRYTVETQDMREPLFVRWHAQHGKVQNRSARSTAIAFDLCGTRAGQIWTAVITTQVTDAETCDTIIKGTFVQIRVVDA
jgi:hypothetical protein